MKKSSVVGIIVGDEILLLKRQPKEEKIAGWCLPGGKRDQGEDGIGCAIRETYEETSIVIENPIYTDKEKSATKEFIVKCYYIIMDKKHPVNLSIREHSEYKWVKISEVDNYELAGNTKKFINLILKHINNVI